MVDVILKQNVEHLGSRGDIVKVSDGYARNFLLPRSSRWQSRDEPATDRPREEDGRAPRSPGAGVGRRAGREDRGASVVIAERWATRTRCTDR